MEREDDGRVWVKIDDQFFDKRRMRAAGVAGRELFLAGLCYCAGNMTDGVIEKHVVPLLLAKAEVPKRAVAKLVELGSWTDEGDTFVVKDYLEFNVSRAEWEATLERRREAGRRGADARWHGDSDGTPHGTSHNGSDGKPVADPTRPDPVATDVAPHRPRKRGTRIPDEFEVTAEMQAWVEQDCPAVNWRFESAAFVDWAKSATGAKAVKVDWVRAWRNWMREQQRRSKGGRR